MSTTGTLAEVLRSDGLKQSIAEVLPRHCSPDRFIRMAIQAMNRTPDLARCSKTSVVRCLMDLSMYGLEPDGRRAHLIPFKRNKKDAKGWTTEYECQLIIDYKGLVELVLRSGQVKRIHADVICENDSFEYNLGEVGVHKIDFSKPRGTVYAAYSLCELKDGGVQSVVMTREEIESIRARSRSKDNGPWVTDWNEMAKKTTFRRLSKWLPLSTEIRDAIEYGDEEYESAEPEPMVPRRPLFAPTIDLVPEEETPFDAPPPTPEEMDAITQAAAAAEAGTLFGTEPNAAVREKGRK
jgi:recombination protein RecT